ncbi:ABC transporter ATP-binding protein [Salegentibacter sp. HM20]
MLKLNKVSFAYAEKPILKNINFTLEKGEILSVIGESGCGKSTLLKLIYGLLHTDGKIFWGDRELRGPEFNLVPGEDFIKYLAQDFDLMPPLSVAENIGKHLSNMYPRKKKKRIAELLEVVEMTEVANQKAGHLSGGQQQRVALARALAREPELLLLDEPFSHIDHFRKNKLRRRLFRYLKAHNIACIVATHDSTDALSFADKTIVLKNAKIHAQNSPELLYRNPPNRYVASLFGEVNEIMLKLLKPQEKSRKKILLYPHEIKIRPNSKIKIEVQESYFNGKNYLLRALLQDQTIFIENETALEPGTHTGIDISEEIINSRI